MKIGFVRTILDATFFNSCILDLKPNLSLTTFKQEHVKD